MLSNKGDFHQSQSKVFLILHGTITKRGCMKHKHSVREIMQKLWMERGKERESTVSTLTGFPSSATTSATVPDWSAWKAMKENQVITIFLLVK